MLQGAPEEAGSSAGMTALDDIVPAEERVADIKTDYMVYADKDDKG